MRDVVVRQDMERPLIFGGDLAGICATDRAKAGTTISVGGRGHTWTAGVYCYIHAHLMEDGTEIAQGEGPIYATPLSSRFTCGDTSFDFYIPSDVSEGYYTLKVVLWVKGFLGWKPVDDMQKPIEIVGAGVSMYTLTLGVQGIGRTEPPEGKHQYREGKEVQIQAIPGENQKFERWIGDVENNEAKSTSVVMDADKIVTAVFTEREWFDPLLDALYYGGGAVGIGVGLWSTYQAVMMKKKVMYIPALAGYGGGGYLIYEGSRRD